MTRGIRRAEKFAVLIFCAKDTRSLAQTLNFQPVLYSGVIKQRNYLVTKVCHARCNRRNRGKYDTRCKLIPLALGNIPPRLRRARISTQRRVQCGTH
jgi:hypothetical protein